MNHFILSIDELLFNYSLLVSSGKEKRSIGKETKYRKRKKAIKSRR